MKEIPRTRKFQFSCREDFLALRKRFPTVLLHDSLMLKLLAGEPRNSGCISRRSEKLDHGSWLIAMTDSCRCESLPLKNVQGISTTGTPAINTVSLNHRQPYFLPMGSKSGRGSHREKSREAAKHRAQNVGSPLAPRRRGATPWHTPVEALHKGVFIRSQSESHNGCPVGLKTCLDGA